MHLQRVAALALAACLLASAAFAGALPALAAPPAQAVAGFQVDVNTAQVDFGNEIRFQLRAHADESIRSVLFLYQVDDSTVQNTAVPGYQPGSSVSVAYNWRVASVLVPGSEVRYQWQVEFASGQKTTTKEQSVTYNDTRINWRELQGDQMTVFYPGVDAQAGQALLDEAKKTQTRLSHDYGLTLDKPLRIFAYTRREDYASALFTGQPLDVVTTVGSDRIFVLAPGGTSGMTTALQGLRREVAYALFLQKTQNPYGDPPRWFGQGFMLVFGGEELNADTIKALGQLAQADKLLPLKTLNGNFPSGDRDQALAYAESVSAVKYILDNYGQDKLKALLAAFKEGNTVDDAFKKGLGVTLSQFETRWKNAVKKGATAPARPASGQRPSRSGDGGFIDRVFGPAIDYWQGMFGSYTRPVLFGVVGVIGVGVVALIASPFISIWRRNHEED